MGVGCWYVGVSFEYGCCVIVEVEVYGLFFVCCFGVKVDDVDFDVVVEFVK